MHKCPGIFSKKKIFYTRHNIVKILIYFHCNQNDRLTVSQMAKSHDFKGGSPCTPSFWMGMTQVEQVPDVLH